MYHKPNLSNVVNFRKMSGVGYDRGYKPSPAWFWLQTRPTQC